MTVVGMNEYGAMAGAKMAFICCRYKYGGMTVAGDGDCGSVAVAGTNMVFVSLFQV